MRSRRRLPSSLPMARPTSPARTSALTAASPAPCNPMKKTAWLAFCFLGLVWGSNFIFVKRAAEYLTPAQITLLRVVFGFLPVFLFALLRGELRWSHARHAHHFVVMALLATALYYFAFAKGTALLPSS